MKFLIKKIETKTQENLSKSIFIEFTYFGEKKTVYVKITENFFDLGWKVIGGNIELNNGINYWVSDTISFSFSFRFVNSIRLEFYDLETNDMLHSEIYPINNNNTSLRSYGKNISTKNIWVIGDSNTYNYFNKYETPSSDLKINNSLVIPIDIPELSINRFVNRDHIKFIKSLPIMDGDDIIFILGEIDCRVGFFKNSQHKKNNIIDQINNVTDRYIKSLLKIKEEFKNNNIITSLPNPALRDGWLKEKDIEGLLYNSTQKDRLFNRFYFEKYYTKEAKKNEIECLNLTHGFENNLGFTKDSILVNGDTHNKKTDIVFENIKKYYND